MDDKTPVLHRKILDNFFRFAMSTGTTMVLSLALKLYLPRVLGPEKLGAFYFTESFSMLFFIFLSFGTQSYIARTVPPNNHHAKEIFSTLFVSQVLFSLLLEACLYVGLKILDSDQETTNAALVMGIQYAVMMLQTNLFKCMFISLERYKLVIRINILTKVVLVSSSLAVLHFKPEIIYLSVCFLIAELTGLTILLSIAYRENLLCKNLNFPLLKGILRLSMPFFITGIFGDIYNSIDSSMLTILTGPKEAGYYGAAFRLIGVCLVFVPIIDSAIMPTLSKSFKESIPEYTLLLRNIMDFLLLVSFPIALAIVLFGQEITLILFGPGFEKSYRIMVFLAPILLVIYLNVFLAVGLKLSTNGYKMALVLCFTTLINIIIKRFMIPFGASQWGEGGAGMAAAISTFGAEMLIFSLLLMITPHRSFDWRSAKNCLLSIAPVFIAAVFYESIAETPVYLKIIGFIIGTPLYALAIGLLSIKNILQILQLRNIQKSP